MDISGWLPSAVAFFVGIGSVLMSNYFIDNREKRQVRHRRTESMKEYAHALLEWHLYHFSSASIGAGNHPAPNEDRITECARKFYPYLHEFKGHKEYGNLMSPYHEYLPGEAPWEASDFYRTACDAVEKHLADYPRAPKKNPYETESK